MAEEKLVRVTHEQLHKLIKDKFMAAGLPEDQAEETANHLVYADSNGVHSHGAVRVEYYSERIAKGGINCNPKIKFEQTGPATGIFHGDNAQGQYVANLALEPLIRMAKEVGVAVVGVSRCGHTGTLSYYCRKLAEAGLISIAMTQSDPMVVPFGGAEPYYGTNPIGFAAPRAHGGPIVVDLATTVQAWGKVLDKRSKNELIPDTWAVGPDGNPTTDPHNIAGLVPIAGPKGYALMMMVDILASILVGLPFGKHVSSMYSDLTAGRNLGQFYIAIDPERFAGLDQFKADIDKTVEELHQITPADGYDHVRYPGEGAEERHKLALKEGIEIPEQIYNYLLSDDIHYDHYDNKNAFAEDISKDE